MTKYLVKFVDSASGQTREQVVEAESDFDAWKNAISAFWRVVSVFML